MDAELKTKWVEALRSGEYQQEHNTIGSVSRRHLCCLGVGAVALDPTVEELHCTDAAVKILTEHGFDGFVPDSDDYSATVTAMINMNDVQGKSFAEIADWIEEHL